MNDSYHTKYNRVLLGIKEKKIVQKPTKKKEVPIKFRSEELDPAGREAVEEAAI